MLVGSDHGAEALPPPRAGEVALDVPHSGAPDGDVVRAGDDVARVDRDRDAVAGNGLARDDVARDGLARDDVVRDGANDAASDVPVARAPGDPAPDDEVLARLDVDTLPLADVRAVVRDVVTTHGWPPPVERTLALLTTELVANAQNHGPTRGRVALTLVRTAEVVRVEVEDEGAAPPVVRQPPPDAVNGRGMLLVQHLAQEWGSELLPDGGKKVWFALVVGSS